MLYMNNMEFVFKAHTCQFCGKFPEKT